MTEKIASIKFEISTENDTSMAKNKRMIGMVSSIAFSVIGNSAWAESSAGDRPDTAALGKIGKGLDLYYNQNQAASSTQSLSAASEGRVVSDALTKYLPAPRSDGFVVIDAVAQGSPDDLAATMKAMGAKNVTTYRHLVSAAFPAHRLNDLGASQYLASANVATFKTSAGKVTSQAHRSMRTNKVRREFQLRGDDVRIGLISDSFGCRQMAATSMEDDIANGDLPRDITILIEAPFGCGDEGRAMGQLVHDIAPNASLAFTTAFLGKAAVAQGIKNLALVAGADVIVDDVGFPSEPLFQDGIVAQAVDEVARLGVPYYSSAGNGGANSLISEYRAVETTVNGESGTWHDFDAGEGTDFLFRVTHAELQPDPSLPPEAQVPATSVSLSLYTDRPSLSATGTVGSGNIVTAVAFDEDGNRLPECELIPMTFEIIRPDGGGMCHIAPFDGGNTEPFEFGLVVDFDGGSTFEFGILTESGPAPDKIGLLGLAAQALEYPAVGPTTFGHPNARGAEAVAASAFYLTQRFSRDDAAAQARLNAGERPCRPACVNQFSARGGLPILLDTAGNRLEKPEIRLKPGITGPDGVNTTFFGFDTQFDDDDGDGVTDFGEENEFPNFFGTSASAPNIAAFAGLLIDAENSQIRTRGRNDELRFRMCELSGFPKRARRKFGTSRLVAPHNVADRVEKGWLLGPCSRTEPQEIYDVVRSTADNITLSVDTETGVTVGVTDETGPDGFDHDSGFGFINGTAAIAKFISDRSLKVDTKDVDTSY